MIYVPKIYGMCNGAKKALDLVYELYNREQKKDNPKNVVIYKELLHNQYIIDDLETKKIRCINDLSEVNSNDIVVIRAHGEGKDTYEYLEKNNIEYYDATCKNVLQIHDIIKEKYYQKHDIIIIGKVIDSNKFHPEVEGSNGWCDKKAQIIDNVEDIEHLSVTKDNVLIICQTTINEQMANMIAEKIKEKFANKKIEYVNSICNAQKLIQKYSLEIARKCKYMIVIGGKNSSNTNELYMTCNTVCESIKVSTLPELYDWLKSKKITKEDNIGITGGASTPKQEIDEYKQLIEFYIFYSNEKKLFESEIENYNQSFIKENDNQIISDALDKFVNINQGGKYLRACLISLGYKISSNKNDNLYLPLSIAYETFQTSILVHDDIIDNASKRRGKDTIPNTYIKQFTSNNKKIGNEVANSLGLCIGDLGFYLANQIIFDNYSNCQNIYQILKYYNDIVVNTIKGEILDVKLPYDLQYEKSNNCYEENIFEIYKLKTSWYTIVGPFCLGLILGGKSVGETKKFESILENMGIAFQIKDDIIGIYGNADYIGKSTNSDISEFKQTILYSYVCNYNKKYLNKLNKYYGKQNLTKEEIELVKQIFIDSGALDYANNTMNNLFNKSTQQIKELKLDSKYNDIILGFINYLKIRQK